MPRMLLFTLGFEEKFAIRAFTRHGLDAGDRILLLTAKPAVDRVVRAYGVLKEFVERYYGGSVDVRLAEVELSDFPVAVAEIRKLIHKHMEGCNKLVANLSGGLRALVLATYTALLTIGESIDMILEVEFEDGSRLVEVPKGILHALKLVWGVSEERRHVLEAIARRGEATASQLAEELQLDVSTIRRHIRRLENEGLVEVISRRPLVVRPKDAARILL